MIAYVPISVLEIVEDILHAGVRINDMPPDSYWSLAGIGNSQLKMNSLGIAIGGGVRVGLEDNIWYDAARTKLATNLDLIKRIHVIAKTNKREIMSAQEFRTVMNFLPGNGQYGRIFN